MTKIIYYIVDIFKSQTGGLPLIRKEAVKKKGASPRKLQSISIHFSIEQTKRENKLAVPRAPKVFDLK